MRKNKDCVFYRQRKTIALIIVLILVTVLAACQAAGSETEYETVAEGERFLPGGFYSGGQWLVGVLHNHTTFSDGIDEPEEMMELAVELGLDFLYFHDHNLAWIWHGLVEETFVEMRERVHAKAEELGLLVGVGIEVGVFTEQESVRWPGYPSWYGEFLAFNLTNFIDVTGLNAREAITQALADNPGSFISIAHPFSLAEDTFWMGGWDIPGITHMEVWNAYEDGYYYLGDWRQAGLPDDPNNLKAFMAWDYLNNRGLRIFGTAGSDSHDMTFMDTVFSVHYIGTGPATMEAIYESFINGRFYGSNGPRITEFTVNGEMMGGTTAAGELEIVISLEYNRPITRVWLYKNGYVLEEWEPGTTTFEITVESEAEQWDFFRVMFESRPGGGRPGFAFSNPVFIGE